MSIHTHKYVCWYVCLYGWMDEWRDGWMYICMYACMSLCIPVYPGQTMPVHRSVSQRIVVRGSRLLRCPHECHALLGEGHPGIISGGLRKEP